MIVALIVLVPLLMVGLCFYVRSRPKVEARQERLLLIFDGLVLVGILLTCACLVEHFRWTTGQSVDRGWWPVLAVLSCLFIAAMILFVGGVLRNWVFSWKK